MRFIVVGMGIQGNKRAALAGSSVVAIVDPIHPKANAKSVTDLDPDSFDAAFVCTPNEPKFEILSYLLSKKKHVLVEKPLTAASNNQLETLKKLSEANKVACYCAYNHRFEPHLAAIKELIQSDTLGPIYLLKILYGNGTARDVRNSAWRDTGSGVLPDLGSHMLDLVRFFFESREFSFVPLQACCAENRALDYVTFGTPGGVPSITLEATLLSWKNAFRVDVIGEKGSAHLDGLCKWGPSTLAVRKRVLPSGRPDEEIKTLVMSDPTWALEYKHFLDLCKTGGNNILNDLWIHEVLEKLSQNLPRL